MAEMIGEMGVALGQTLHKALRVWVMDQAIQATGVDMINDNRPADVRGTELMLAMAHVAIYRALDEGQPLEVRSVEKAAGRLISGEGTLDDLETLCEHITSRRVLGEITAEQFAHSTSAARALFHWGKRIGGSLT